MSDSNTALDTINQTVTATEVPETERLAAMDQFLSTKSVEFEIWIYSLMDQFTTGYDGGYWNFYQLSNGGFFMSLMSDEKFQVSIDSNYFKGEMSAEAISIVVNLFAYCLLSEKYQSERFTDLYHNLLAYAYDHAEAGLILGAID